jgi:hypothetical protein
MQKNFEYKNDNEVKGFTEKYLSDIISTEQKPCKNPIIQVIGGNKPEIISLSRNSRNNNI